MAEGIGARLRSARERSRLTILQAAERLHVDPDVLEALETDDFAALGAPVYVKGHLRHYAELVGESADALFDLYTQGTRVAAPDLTRVPKPVENDSGRLIAPAVIALIGFAVAGTVWWGLSLSHHSAAASRAMPFTVSTTTAVQPGQPMRVAMGGPQGGIGAAATVAAATPVLPSSSAVPAVSAKAAATAHGQIDARLTYSANSWTEVYDATGRRLLYGMTTGPGTRKLEGVPPLIVLLGDAAAVTIAVGGHAVSFSHFVRSDHTARFQIAPDGRALAAPPKKGD